MKEIAVLIVLGGELELQFLKQLYEETRPDMVIAADGGLTYVREAGLPCSCGLGDFDTISAEVVQKIRQEGSTELVVFPPEKDQTDAELALELAINKGAERVWIAGACGGRLDHMIGNLGLLKKALDQRIPCVIADPQNRISLIDSRETFMPEEEWKYISFLPYTDEVSGITLQGFRYPLQNAVFKRGSTLGVSNEITDSPAVVTLTSGILYCIRSRDL